MRKAFLPLYNRVSIKTKILIAFCIISLCPIILVGYVGYRSYENTMKKKFLNYAYANSAYISSYVGDIYNEMENFSNSILYDDVIHEAHGEYSNMGDSDISDYIIKRKLDGYLQSLMLARPELDMVAFKFTGKEGLYVSSRRITKNTSRFIPIDEIYNLTNNDPNLQCYIDAKDGLARDIYFYRMVYNRNDMQEIGLLVFKINQQQFNLDSHINSPIEGIYIYSNSYDQIFKPSDSNNKHTDAMIELMKKEKKPGIYEAGKDYIIYETIEPLQWNLFMSISSNELFSEVRNQFKIILLLCLSTFPIILIIINYIFLDIIRPINILVNKMHQMEIGETGVTMTWNRRDEIGYLVSSFNKMSTEIDDLINRVYKEEIAFVNAEIKALQAQINPHFLYNTLETINWTAQLNGVDEISDMVMALSALMEAGIDRNGQKFVTLEQEINYVDNYIFIIQKRHGDKIGFKKIIDEDTIDYNMPRLIIQPLIENAIYHGIEPKGRGEIQLISGYIDNLMVIHVIDNGIGIDEKTMKWLSTLLSDKPLDSLQRKEFSNTEIGIINVHRRIQLIFGKQYGLYIESSSEGTIVTITLPADGKMISSGKEIDNRV